MLHLRLSVDAKCPLHPRRSYNNPPAGCGICQAIVAAADLANRAARELLGASRLGAELRWKGIRRARVARPSADLRKETPPAPFAGVALAGQK